MSDDFVTPTTDRIPLSGGAWIEVKRELNAGEERDVFVRKIKDMRSGERAQIDPAQIGWADILAYVVDWSFAVKGPAFAFSEAALSNLKPERFSEIRKAVEKHIERGAVDLEKEKNALAGASGS